MFYRLVLRCAVLSYIVVVSMLYYVVMFMWFKSFPHGSVKNPPAMQETWVSSLGWEDPLERGMAAHSSILAWRIPWTEEPDGL